MELRDWLAFTQIHRKRLYHDRCGNNAEDDALYGIVL